MATTMVIEQREFPKVIQEWLSASGVPENTLLEMHFLDGEVVIRPQSAARKDLHEWLESAMRRYDNLLKRLSKA